MTQNKEGSSPEGAEIKTTMARSDDATEVVIVVKALDARPLTVMDVAQALELLLQDVLLPHSEDADSVQH